MLKFRGSRVAVVLALTLACLACDPGPPATPPLNSERIEQVFGSYGVDVLFGDEFWRISSLYSTDDGIRTTRTLAVVNWTPSVPASLADTHAAILDGASIGATLEAAGWTVEKRNFFFGETQAPEAVSQLMRVPTGTMLAIHGYGLAVARDGQSFGYATIAEVHHPDYLGLEMVESIYGEVLPGDAVPEIQSFVEQGFAWMDAQPSGRSE